MFNRINKLTFWSQAVLPTAYTDALSYYEDLNKMKVKINEMIKAYNELIDYYNSLEGLLEEMQGTLNQLKAKMEEIQAKFTALETELKNEFTELEQAINDKQEMLENKITVKLGEIDAKIEQAEADQKEFLENSVAEIYGVIADNKTEVLNSVDEKLKEFLDNLPDVQDVLVTNPVTGEVTTVSEALQDILNYLEKDQFMPDIFTGELVSPAVNIDKLAQIEMAPTAYTAEQFDNENSVTAEDYDALTEDAVTMDWRSNRVLYPYQISDNENN